MNYTLTFKRTWIVFLFSFYSCSYSQTAENPVEELDPNTIQNIIQSKEFNASIEKLISREIAYGHFSGVVMIKHHNQTLYSKASKNLPVEINTRFDIGSISKQFTAAAILELASMGLLELNDPINKHLENNSSKKWEKINIHHLLTHTSGIPSIYQTEQGLEIFYPEENPTSIEYLIDKFKDKKLLFSPGEEFSYSNSGYVLLAAIIENVSGMSFQSFMEENIFGKYKLINTSFNRNSESAAPKYGYRNDLLRNAPIYHPSWMIGGGGIYSNAEDLLKWTKTIQSDEFLNKELRDIFLKIHTNVGYGYGWQILENGRIQHDGGTAGFISFLSFNPKLGISMVVLTNRSFEKIDDYGKSATYVRELVEKIWDRILGDTIEPLPAITSTPIKTGTYIFKNQKLTISPASDTSYVISYTGAPITRLVPNTPIAKKDERSEDFIKLANALEKREYWKLAKYGNGEMKFVCYSGLMRYGMKEMRKQTGKVDTIVPYQLKEKYGLLRMKGEIGNLDLIVYFDNEGKMQGIFENGFHDVDKEQPLLAYSNDNTLYVDGLPYGEASCLIKIEDATATITQFDREVILTQKAH